jgi:hypothetical protein
MCTWKSKKKTEVQHYGGCLRDGSGRGVDRTGSGSRLMVICGDSSVHPSGSATTVLDKRKVVLT